MCDLFPMLENKVYVASLFEYYSVFEFRSGIRKGRLLRIGS